MKSKNDEIIFKAELRFKGSVSDYKNVLTNLHNLGIDGLKIDTVPQPDAPPKGIMIGTWPTPEKGAKSIRIDTVPQPDAPPKGIMIGTWPTPEKGAKSITIDIVPQPDTPAKSIMIGAWPTPEKGAKGIMIDTVPLPEKKFNGLIIGTWPILEKNGRFGIIPMPEKGLSHDLEKDLIDGMPSFKINTDIDGGIRTAHLHIKDKIYLIDRDRFKEHVGQIALEIMRDLTEKIEEFSSQPLIPT